MSLRLDDANLGDFLHERGLIPSAEGLEIEPAGDGNINWVRRVRWPGGSLIVKQARARLERFPEYQAPTERIVFEARWLEHAARFDEDRVRPEVLHVDEAARVLVREDLGRAERLDAALARGADARAAAATLAALLGRIHAGTRDPALAASFENEGMRRLHGEHIFLLPLRESFALAPEVEEAAAPLRANASLGALGEVCFKRYMEPRGSLVHADVQAGNVLLAERGPVLLDAEIAHVGDPAFDVATLLAHLALPRVAAARPEDARGDLEAAWDAYANAFPEPEGGPGHAAAARLAGFEMLRRTIGAARVACVEPPEAALRVLSQAKRWIEQAPDTPAALTR